MTTLDPADRNLVLTGFMGTGKTTTGRIVAERLGRRFVDTDAVIEERHGPIGDIFRDRGEDAFRSIEHDVARELSFDHRSVISTGGRMLLDPRNAHAFCTSGRVFCLTAEPEQILERVLADGGAADRPLLAVDDPRQRIVDLLQERAAGYARFAQVVTGGRAPDEVADELVSLLTTPPHRVDVGLTPWHVGAAILPLHASLAGIDGPVSVVAVGDGREHVPQLGAEESLDRPTGRRTTVALGGRTLLTDAAGPATVLCPTDLDAVDAARSLDALAVIVDVATLQPGAPLDALVAGVLGLIADPR